MASIVSPFGTKGSTASEFSLSLIDARPHNWLMRHAPAPLWRLLFLRQQNGERAEHRQRGAEVEDEGDAGVVGQRAEAGGAEAA